jgi:two-component system LytT family response regulator
MLLADDPEVVVIGECADGREAVAAVLEKRPDLLFLDVQMPEMSGFEVLEELGVAELPALIFVTAYDKYALRAFEVHAVDYLLKPISSERLAEAVERAKSRLGNGSGDDLSRRVAAILEELRTGEKPLERVVVKSAGRIFFLGVDEIDWIEAVDAYVRLHVGPETHLVRGTMSGLEAKLDPAKFLRVHRSRIVNIASIKELSPLFHGEYCITLRDGTRLTSGRSYKDKLQTLLNNRF